MNRAARLLRSAALLASILVAVALIAFGMNFRTAQMSDADYHQAEIEQVSKMIDQQNR